jgi:hypothetical protein
VESARTVEWATLEVFLGGLTDSEGADLMSAKLKILLAEDEPSIRCYIQTLMSQWECELAVEQTGADAITRAANL